MTKKYLSLALTIPMACLAIACGSSTPEAETPEGAAAPEAPAAAEVPVTETPAETPADPSAAPADAADSTTESAPAGGGTTP